MSDAQKRRTPPCCQVAIDWQGPKIRNGAKIAAIGSCFAADIAERLFEAGFPGVCNPNGIVYNAVSIAEALKRAAKGPAYAPSEFFEFGGLFHSWAHHGDFSAATPEKAAAKAEASRLAFLDALRNCELFIATPASSVVYELPEEKRVVANCHKVPNSRFERRLLSVEENLSALKSALAALRSVNPSCVALLTLSPVRHYPGDLALNARSKAHLLTAIHLCREACENVRYFPAYEIVIDELRDYRFFKEDMLHPNETAVEYVLRAFVESCFEAEAMAALDEARRRRKAAGHRSQLRQP